MKWFLIVLMIAPAPMQREYIYLDHASCIAQRDELRAKAAKERILASIVCEPDLRGMKHG